MLTESDVTSHGIILIAVRAQRSAQHRVIKHLLWHSALATTKPSDVDLGRRAPGYPRVGHHADYQDAKQGMPGDGHEAWLWETRVCIQQPALYRSPLFLIRCRPFVLLLHRGPED